MKNSSAAGLRNVRALTLGVITIFALAACGGGEEGDPSNPDPTPGSNSAPTITGSPDTSITAGSSYSFEPSASDADGDTLTYAIDNKPAWAQFSESTGKLWADAGNATAGTYSGIVISVSDGEDDDSLGTFTITVTSGSGGANVAPTISGIPSSSATAGNLYSFTPNASDANGDTLTFSVTGLPSWASVNSHSGTISGTPSSAGHFGGIVMTVSDGSLSDSLPAFSIDVTAGNSGTGEYPGYTYSLPTVRPFISLDHYNSGGATSPAYLRLKGQVDDAVVVTTGVGSGASYDQLISALNSGHYGYSATDSVIMFRRTNDPKYIDQAIRMVDLFVQAENATINSGGIPQIAHDSYLEVGFFMEQLALTYDYGYSRLSAGQRSAWSTFAETTLYNLWNYQDAEWGGVSHPWTGWSVEDPGNNYFYSFLKATQLWALASQNLDWFSFLQEEKYSILVPFFYELTGGGSREGTGYGTAMGNLFEDYAYWKESTGEDLGAYTSHASDSIDYWIHATVPTFDYFASIGDQSRSSMPIMFDYQRKLVAEAVALDPSSDQAKRGTWWLSRVKVTDGGSGFLLGKMRYNYNYKYDLLTQAGSELAPSSTMYNATGTGALFARSGWTSSASWMHTNAGYYDQSHAHQDQGAFSFYKNGWLTITSNVYSNSGINQDVGVENVIRFMSGGNAIEQDESVSSKTVNDDGTVLQIDETLTPAYANSGGKVSNWRRELTYDRSVHSLAVHDFCTVSGGTTAVWQLHTPAMPVAQGDGSYLAGHLRITPTIPASPTVNVVNMHSLSSEFDEGYRLEISGGASCEFQVTLKAE